MLASSAGFLEKAKLITCLFSLLLFSFAATANDYLISPGDKISIHVYGEPELSFDSLAVPKNGAISYPFLGVIRVAELSESQLAENIKQQLKNGYLIDPQVTVSVSAYRPIFVGGSVETPGKHNYLVNMDVERVIAVAGGFTESADRNAITILREMNSTTTEVQARMDMKVFPGDIITVGRIPEEELRSAKLIQEKYIYLYGEIKKPGRYEFTPGLSVEKAIALAGGFNPRASKRKINVSRGSPARIAKKVPLDYSIKPDDVITVGASLF